LTIEKIGLLMAGYSTEAAAGGAAREQA